MGDRQSSAGDGRRGYGAVHRDRDGPLVSDRRPTDAASVSRPSQTAVYVAGRSRAR